jgi:hypothetical protein
MLNSLCDFFKNQNLQQSCLGAANNPVYQAGLGFGVCSALGLLAYNFRFKSKNKASEDEVEEFEYIPTTDDLLQMPEMSGNRKLPIQSLLVAYFANDRDSSLHSKYKGAIGKILIPSEGALTFPEIVTSMLEKLGLPLDGSYPEELKKRAMTAEEILAWCLEKKDQQKRLAP